MYRNPFTQILPAGANPLWLLLLFKLWHKFFLQTPEPGPEPIVPECKGIAHVVGPGDSLWTLSIQYGVTIEELLAENPQIVNPDLIFTGEVICIPKRD